MCLSWTSDVRLLGQQGAAGRCKTDLDAMRSFVENGTKLKLIHRTSTGAIPGALTPFRGLLLAGVGSSLRLYEAGEPRDVSRSLT